MTSEIFPPLDDDNKSNSSTKPKKLSSLNSDTIINRFDKSGTTSGNQSTKSTKASVTSNNPDEFDLNAQILSDMNQEKFSQKIADAQENAAKAFQENDDDKYGYFDQSSHTPPQMAPTFENIPISELQEHAATKPATTKFGKSRNFRLIPSSFFGKIGLIFAAVIVGSVGISSYNVNKHNATAQSTSAIYTTPSNFDQNVLKAMTNSRMNNLLNYMDNRAANVVHEAAKNWHMVNYAVSKGYMTNFEGLTLLQTTKSISEASIKQIKEDKDDIVVLYKKFRNGEDVYQERNSFYINKIDPKDPTYNLVQKPTSFETFMTWHNRSTNASYIPEQLRNITELITFKLGNKSKDASSYAYVQMATGVKPQYQSINNPQFTNPNGIQDIPTAQNKVMQTKDQFMDSLNDKLKTIQNKNNELSNYQNNQSKIKP